MKKNVKFTSICLFYEKFFRILEYVDRIITSRKFWNNIRFWSKYLYKFLLAVSKCEVSIVTNIYGCWFIYSAWINYMIHFWYSECDSGGYIGCIIFVGFNGGLLLNIYIGLFVCGIFTAVFWWSFNKHLMLYDVFWMMGACWNNVSNFTESG